MRRSTMLVALVALASIASTGIGQAADRTETKPYIAFDVNVTGPIPGGLTNDCTGVLLSLGGSCFVVNEGDAFAHITVADLVTTAPCAVAFWSDASVPLATNIGTSKPFNTSTTVAVPAGATILWVNVPLLGGLIGTQRDLPTGEKCFTNHANGPGTTGNITVTFSGSPA